MAQLVACVLSVHEALALIPSLCGAGVKEGYCTEPGLKAAW